MVWDQLGLSPDLEHKTVEKLSPAQLRELCSSVLHARLNALPVDKRYRAGTQVLRHPWSSADDLVRVDFCARCQEELHVDDVCVEPLCSACVDATRPHHWGDGQPHRYSNNRTRGGANGSDRQYHGGQFNAGEW